MSEYGDTGEVISDNGSSLQQNLVAQCAVKPSTSKYMIAEYAQFQHMATNHSHIHTRWTYTEVICGVQPRRSQRQKEEVDVVAVSDT